MGLFNRIFADSGSAGATSSSGDYSPKTSEAALRREAKNTGQPFKVIGGSNAIYVGSKAYDRKPDGTYRAR
jgi:hypothetical protein